ncbi:MAG: hypothetical protein AABX39_05620, partial [Nanoarchaeota archaeon]
DAPVINWNNSESGDYKLVLVGVKEVEKNWLRRFYYRNVPEFKSISEKSTRYCALLLENKFIPGKYEGEVTYFESDPFVFRAITLEKSQIDLFREKNICHGTIDCKFDYFSIDEKFVLPSSVKNGTFEYQEMNGENISKYFNAIVSETSQTNKCERLENIVQMHAFMESIFCGRTTNYIPSQELFPERNILSMNKILGTDPLEKNSVYWAKNLSTYAVHSTEGLKEVHFKDYQNIFALNFLNLLALTGTSFLEFSQENFNAGALLFTAASLTCIDLALRAAQTNYYSKAANKLQNRPGIIGTARDFLKFWKDVFV